MYMTGLASSVPLNMLTNIQLLSEFFPDSDFCHNYIFTYTTYIKLVTIRLILQIMKTFLHLMFNK